MECVGRNGQDRSGERDVDINKTNGTAAEKEAITRQGTRQEAGMCDTLDVFLYGENVESQGAEGVVIDTKVWDLGVGGMHAASKSNGRAVWHVSSAACL